MQIFPSLGADRRGNPQGIVEQHLEAADLEQHRRKVRQVREQGRGFGEGRDPLFGQAEHVRQRRPQRLVDFVRIAIGHADPLSLLANRRRLAASLRPR